MACKRCKKPCIKSKLKEVIIDKKQIVVVPKGKLNAKEIKKEYNGRTKRKRIRKKW